MAAAIATTIAATIAEREPLYADRVPRSAIAVATMDNS